MAMPKKHVIVIGAGPAGLSFADKLLELSADFSVTILEKSNYIGGISKTVNFEGNRIDIGGHRFFSKSDEVMNWWAQKFPVSIEDVEKENFELRYQGQTTAIPNGFRTASTKDKESSNVLLLRTRKSRIIHDKKLYDYPLKINNQTLANIGALKIIQVSLSYIKSKINFKEPLNLEQFIVSRFGNTLYKMFFESYTEKVWGRHPSEISAEWGAQRIKGLSIRKILQDVVNKALAKLRKEKIDISQKNIETSLIEKFLYPKYGPGQIWEFVAKELEENQHVTINMNSELTEIEISAKEDVAKVKYRVSDGSLKTLDCDFVISCMPISKLVECLHIENKDNQLTKSTVDSAKNLPYRDFLTVGLLLRNFYGPNGEELDDTWLYVQEPNVKVGRIQIFNNWSPYMVEDKNYKWVGLEYFCQEGDQLWSMNNNQLIDLALHELSELGLCNKRDYLKGTVLKEEKTYPAYFDSYSDIENIKEALIKVTPLFLIGRNGMHKYNNQDHSMLTAFRTAELIADRNINATSKKSVWDVNTEQEYHETK